MIISKCTSNLNMKRNKIKPMKTKHQTYQEWTEACLDCMLQLPRSSTGRRLQRDNTYLKRDFAQLRSIVQAQPAISPNWNAQWTAVLHLPDIPASVTTVLTVLWGIPDCLVSNVKDCWTPVLWSGSPASDVWLNYCADSQKSRELSVVLNLHSAHRVLPTDSRADPSF